MGWDAIKEFNPITWCDDTLITLTVIQKINRSMFEANITNSREFYDVLDNGRRLKQMIDNIKKRLETVQERSNQLLAVGGKGSW